MNQSIDWTPSKAFKRYGKLAIAGNVARVDDDGTVEWASTLLGYADCYRPGTESRIAMDLLEAIATSPSNRIGVKCLSLLHGNENWCPNCGTEFL